MTKASDNLFPGIILNEAANDGSDFSNPSADYRRVFLGEDAALHAKDSAGAVTQIGPGTIGTFTPTWTASVTNPTIGDGSILGFYQKIAEKLYWFNITITFGSSSTDGSGQYVIGNLPFTAKSTTPAFQVVAASIRDAGTASYSCTGRLAAGGTTIDVLIVADGTGSRHWSDTMPITLANGDGIFVEGVVATD